MPGSSEPSLTIGIDGRELLPDRITGVGRYLRNFLESRALRASPHRILVYGNQRTRPVAWGANVSLRTVPERLTPWWDQHTLRRYSRLDGLDVFFSPYDKAPVLAACPVVMTFHDLLFLTVPEQPGWRASLYGRLYLISRGTMVRRARLVLTVSDHARRDISRILCVRPSRIRVVYNGVCGRYAPNADARSDGAVLRRYGIARPYLLYVGNFKPHKNVPALLKAYAGLPLSLRGDVSLVLAGAPDIHTPGLRECADRLGLSDRVHFTGMVEEPDLPAIYRCARCLVHPSLYEGFGLTPLEAMACGTPVVASRTTSLPEVVGGAGILVDPRSPADIRRALRRLLTCEGLRRKYADAGLRRAQCYTSEAAAGRILAALKEAAGHSGKGAR